MPVSYDDYIKKPFVNLEYTQHMIQEIEACSNDPEYFFNNYVRVQHPDKGLIPFFLYPHQERMLDLFHNNRFVIAKTPRQYGKSIFCAAYILWFCCFNRDKTSGIVSNMASSAIEVLDRLKGMYEALPVWLKPGVKTYAAKTVAFDNGSRVIASATSKNSFRGWTINGILLADEFCHVGRNIQEEFWSSNYPTISASKESKLILISTPLGMYDLFYNIYTKAEKGLGPFKYLNVHWSEHPERDEVWLQDQRDILGETLFNQEVMTVFLGSTNSVIDTLTLEHLLTQDIDPISYQLNNNLRVYEMPIEGSLYVIGVDTSKGTGEHYSTMQVLKINSIKPFRAEQVAVFQDNSTDVYTFCDIIYRTSLYYNKAHLLIENNAEGSTIVNRIWWDFEYENLVNESSKSTGIGVRATKMTKPKAVIIMKKLLENKDLTMRDGATIRELATFVETKNNIFKGKDGMVDDLVSALYWACYIVEFDLFDENMTINTDIEDDVWGTLSDVDLEDNEWMFN